MSESILTKGTGILSIGGQIGVAGEGCCNCCCPTGESCCKAQGPGGICCPQARCCGTEGAPVCCNEGETCCESVCCPPGECCNDGECGPCECESDEDCPEGECCNDGECGPCECESDEDCPEGECCNDGECGPCECESDEDCPEGECCNDGECGPCKEECELDEDCPEGQVCCEYVEWIDNGPEGIITKPGVCIDPPCCFCESYHDTLNLRIEWPGLWEDEYTLNLRQPIPFNPQGGCVPVWDYASDDLETNETDGLVCKGESLAVGAGPAPSVQGVKVLEDGSRLSFFTGGGNNPNGVYLLTKRDPEELPGDFMWCSEYSFSDNWEELLQQFPGFSLNLQQAYPNTDFCSTNYFNTDIFFRGGGFWYLSSP